ncbi:MAG: peptidoglycan editing factor PgeF [Cellulomonas sp.]
MPTVAGVLPVVEVDLGPGVRAGFTTRSGGVSEPPWESLNLGLGVGDSSARVLANRRLVERWAGARVAFASQVHGAGVLVLSEPPARSATSVGPYDALVSTSSSVAVAVLVADCVPVLLADVEAGVVGAVHAGRRGLVAGVVQSAVDALVGAGARTARLRAVVGPSISGAAYEVPAAMRAEVAAAVPETWATTQWGTPSLDLPAGVEAVLARAGVRDVRCVEMCTTMDERFFSHRSAGRHGGSTGRFAGVIHLEG